MEFKYDIGNLVALRNHPYMEKRRDGETQKIVYVGSIINCSSDNYPLMMIKECLQSFSKKEELDATSNELKEKQIIAKKYLCIWYDSFEGKFQDAILKEEALIPFEGKLAHPVAKEIKVGETIYINTSLAERYKQIHNQNRQNDHYVASSFLVVDKVYVPQSEWVSPKYGFVEKKISGLMLKVKWFNVHKARYSEELIPYECFQAFPQLIDRDLWGYINPDSSRRDQIQRLPNLTSLISTKNENYKVQNSIDGKSLEELIFFYIRSEGKAILDDRVRAFDNYLERNKYTVLAHRVSLNSLEYPDHKHYKVPIDLILKDSDDYIHIVDILTGNCIVKDDNISSNKIEEITFPTTDENVSNIAVYNGRMNIVKQLIEGKYNNKVNGVRSSLENYLKCETSIESSNIKYKLLIINRKLDCMIKEVECKEDSYFTEHKAIKQI